MNVALITGASGGIGQALCSVFREAGYFVIGCDCNSGDGDYDEFIDINLQDLSKSQEKQSGWAREIREKIGANVLKVIVNNAAIQILAPTERISISHWNETLNLNLIVPFVLLQEFLPELESSCGSCINIASIHSVVTKPNFVCYATSKAALVGMTRALAVDLGPRVRVNCISPAAIATPMLLAGFESCPGELNRLAGMHPLLRIGQPWEVAKAALFLASQDAAFITGTTLNVDGGLSSRLHDPM